MSRALDGTNPLSYQGVRPRTPPDMVVPGYVGTSAPRNPTANDINYNVGDFWLNTAGPTLWYLSFLGSHLVAGRNTRYAIWLPFTVGTGFVQHLSGDAGINPVSVDGANNINVFGDHTVGLEVSGDGVHTLLVTSFSGHHFVESLTGNSGGTVFATIGGNINVLGAVASGITVVGTPGTNTLTITSSGGGAFGQTITGNAGGAVAPDAAGNWNVIGGVGSGLVFTGNPGTHTITLTTSGGGGVGQTLTGDAGGAVSFSAGGNINTTGAHGINTLGTPGTNTMSVRINNTITLGDLAVVTAGNDALTITSGNITLSGTGANAAGNINMPNTTTDGRQGVINFGGTRFIHDWGTNNAFVGLGAGNFTMTGIQNNAFGVNTLVAVTTGQNNDMFGTSAGAAITTGQDNHGFGSGSLQRLTTGDDNVALPGLPNLTTGNENVSVGVISGAFLVTGSFNTYIGGGAGGGHTTNESSNICIGNLSGQTAGDNNTLRIGAGAGAGQGQLNRAFIYGIRGITTGNADAIAVLVDSAGQLGTVSSSERYKENIDDMRDYSAPIMELRPVTFNYKDRSSERPCVGLIAEEVGEVMPDLVIFNEDGLPETIRYHDLVPMLLNELQKLRSDFEKFRAQVRDLR